jgi:hypothetical protein
MYLFPVKNTYRRALERQILATYFYWHYKRRHHRDPLNRNPWQDFYLVEKRSERMVVVRVRVGWAVHRAVVVCLS